MSKEIPTLTLNEVQKQYGGEPVEVYYNLHKKLWSVRHYRTRRVVCHTDRLYLLDAVPMVNERGRQRVIREQRKNVHARIAGTVSPYSPRIGKPKRVTYNPYKGETFVYASDLQSWAGSQLVSFTGDRKVFVS